MKMSSFNRKKREAFHKSRNCKFLSICSFIFKKWFLTFLDQISKIYIFQLVHFGGVPNNIYVVQYIGADRMEKNFSKQLLYQFFYHIINTWKCQVLHFNRKNLRIVYKTCTPFRLIFHVHPIFDVCFPSKLPRW